MYLSAHVMLKLSEWLKLPHQRSKFESEAQSGADRGGFPGGFQSVTGHGLPLDHSPRGSFRPEDIFSPGKFCGIARTESPTTG